MARVKPIPLFLGLALIGLIILTSLAVWRINWLLAPVGSAQDYEIIEVHVPLNSSLGTISGILEEEGVIRNALAFALYARYKGYSENLQAGNYLLATNMSFEEILETMQQGVILKEGHRFTIPEGFTVEQISRRLEREGLVESELFLEACRKFDYTGEESRFSFLDSVPPGVKYSLEGYLFPDTYEVEEDITPREIIEMMLSRFEEVFSQEHRMRAEELGLSIHEVVTLASLIEKEARVDEERKTISAVFHNRLQSEQMPFLQSCATVQYALGEVKPRLTNQDLEVDSPFNTYLYPHLPPGPIASPGRHSLEAALYPAEVDYLYFVYREDGTGRHYFSKTLEEHNYYKSVVQRSR